MRVFKKLLLMILTCLLVLPFVGNTAYASSGTISLSDPTVAVGDSVSVTVKATTTDSSTISSVTMELTYDAKILEFESGTSATNEDGIIKISGTADSSIKTYTLTFKALKSGTSAIKISAYDIKDSKSSVIEMSKVGSSTVTVTGEETEDSTNTEATTQDVETQGAQTDTTQTDTTQTDTTQTEIIPTGVSQNTLEDKIVNPPKKDVKVEIAGTPFDICKISEDIIPEGFEYIGYMYGDVAVDAVRKDNIVLFYLNQIGEEAYIFYLYDDETGGFYKYAPVTPCLSYSVIDADESVVIPEGFTASEVSVGGVAVNGWQSDANSEYFLLYIMTSEGKKNLYLYDTVEKTVQRYNGSAIEQTETETQTDSYQTMYLELNENYNIDMQSKTRFLYSLIVLAVILVFIIINLGLRLSDKRHAHLEDEDDEEEEDIEFDEDDEDYNDFDEFDDDYEDEDESDYKSDRQLKKEVKKAAKIEKKEKAKRAKAVKNVKESSKDEMTTGSENDEDDYDDSDGFEMQIFDFDEDK